MQTIFDKQRFSHILLIATDSGGQAVGFNSHYINIYQEKLSEYSGIPSNQIVAKETARGIANQYQNIPAF